MKNLAELKKEFKDKCEQSGLDFQCGMDGTFFSSIAVIAEAPGPIEVQQQLPLVGGSGGLFWRTLKKYCDLTRKDVYITNVSKRQVHSLTTSVGQLIDMSSICGQSYFYGNLVASLICVTFVVSVGWRWRRSPDTAVLPIIVAVFWMSLWLTMTTWRTSVQVSGTQ